ncbi:MAG: hypothetical protein HQK67_01440 [Desulfamplus sp.]|nr:hypothetical protein [Desulfamplus sp.]
MEEKKDITEDTKTYLFDKPANVKGLLGFFFCLLILLIILDFFIHKHGYFGWENWPGFFAAFGFVACVMVISIAKLLRVFAKRDERYYD